MAYAPYLQFQASRMQANAAWLSPKISLLAGKPPSPVDISSWTLDGAAIGQKCQRIPITVTNGRIVMTSVSSFRVSLSVNDMANLGPGEVTIEVMRRSPAPVRPLLRMTGLSTHGVA